MVAARAARQGATNTKPGLTTTDPKEIDYG